VYRKRGHLVGTFALLQWLVLGWVHATVDLHFFSFFSCSSFFRPVQTRDACSTLVRNQHHLPYFGSVAYLPRAGIIIVSAARLQSLEVMLPTFHTPEPSFLKLSFRYPPSTASSFVAAFHKPKPSSLQRLSFQIVNSALKARCIRTTDSKR
jgi:hypothetical protein